jgi:hypothetical protein
MHGKSKLIETKMARQERRRLKTMLIIFLTSRRMFTKNSSCQAKQSIPHTAVTFYGDCVKMCEDFAPKFGGKRTGRCVTSTHLHILLFSPKNF